MRKISLIILTVLFLAVCIGNKSIRAEEKLNPPKIKVKAVKNDTVIKLTVSKIKNAKGFKIYYKNTDNMYAGYRYKPNDLEFMQVVETSGEDKRTVMIKSLPEGTYTIQVCSYHDYDKDNKKYIGLSDLSNEGVVRVKENGKTGYLESYDFTKVKVGDIVKFGAYEQDNNFSNGKEPIEWIVIEKTDKTALLLSKYALDELPYHIRDKGVNWSSCTLRKWLNNVFYNYAFNDKEKKLIKKTMLENKRNEITEESSGKNTKDRVFVLSQTEVKNINYFVRNYDYKDINRRCAPTKYSLAVYDSTPSYYEGEMACTWWLRTKGEHYVEQRKPGYIIGKESPYYVFYVNKAACVYDSGEIWSEGYYVDRTNFVRPSIYIKLKN